MIWRRWPTTGARGGFASAADYDQTVADLVRSGVITDPGMIYFDVRPSAHLPTLELRICDGCPYLQDVVLLAGLFRALVMREADAAVAGRPRCRSAPSCLRPRPGGPPGRAWRATWLTRRPPPRCRPADLIRRMLADLRPALEANGDWDQVTELTESALARGSSAARQRVAYASGGLQEVVDALIKETGADTGVNAVG